MNDRQGDLSCIFVYENEIKCFFLADLPESLQQMIMDINFHRFSERELSGEADGDIVYCIKKPYFMPKYPEKFRINAQLRGLSADEYAIYLSGYPIVDWLVCLCYLSIFRNRILHITVAKIKIKSSGKRLSNLKAFSASSLYPHVAGNSFPIVSNVFGSSSIGNIIPESMVDGKKTIIENIEVFAWSFTAKPIMLAILNDTAIKTARLMKYIPGFFDISALKASGAAIYKIMLMRNK